MAVDDNDEGTGSQEGEPLATLEQYEALEARVAKLEAAKGRPSAAAPVAFDKFQASVRAAFKHIGLDFGKF
jgi:hypothetical protein